MAEDLLEAFPEAKVILTERPVDDWIHSIANTVAIPFVWSSWSLIAWAEPSTAQWHQEALRMQKLTPWATARSNDTSTLRATYIDYYARLRSRCAPGQLLDFKTGEQGMKELAEFLGVDAPDGVEYQGINESKTFVPMYSASWWWTFRIAARKVVGRGLVGFAVCWIVWRRRRDLPRIWKLLKEFVLY